MSKSSSTQITVTTTGDGVTATDSPPAITSTNSPAGGPLKVSMASGDNTLTFPSGGAGLLIIPPTDSTTAKTLKGAGGDTGIKMYPSKPLLYWFKSGETSIILNVGADEVVSLHWL